MSAELTHLSLFSGIGGLDLAAEWAGMRTVGQCEIAEYPHAILCKHWPDVPKWRDIRTLTKESFYERTGMGTVDVVSGGFPCQPFSLAGKQKGKEDDRYLWPELLRVIRELTPRWVIGENVPGILRIAAADVVKDLEREGYNVVVFDFEAAAVGALHRRERIVFVANRQSARMERFYREPPPVQTKRPREGQSDKSGLQITVADGNCKELHVAVRHQNTTGVERPTIRDWWAVEPDVGRVAHGVPNRVDRLKCLGNAVVPQQFYPIFRAIAEVEK